MTSTETGETELPSTAGRERREHRRVWIAAVVGVVVAGVAGFAIAAWTMGTTSSDPEPAAAASATPAASAPDAELVAAAYVETYAAYDRTRLRSYLAGNALASWATLRDDNLRDEALESRILLRSCEALDDADAGTRVNCAFDAHALGSERLGRGPFSNNVFVLTVRDGKVLRSDIFLDYGANGFSVEMWEPFGVWVSQHFPKDFRAMYQDGGDSVRPGAAAADLFHEHIADYIAARTAS